MAFVKRKEKANSVRETPKFSGETIFSLFYAFDPGKNVDADPG